LPDPLRRTIWACSALVWLASWMVPPGRRREWRAQKTNQLWHWCHFLAESGQLGRQQKLELARHCWGLFFEAFWIRHERESFLRRVDQVRRAPSTCLTVIALLLILIVWGSGFIPFARSLFSSAVAEPDRVCVVRLNGKFRRLRSETLFDLASAWKSSKLLDAVAPYSWGPGKLATGKRTVPILSARVAPDFFDILGTKASLGRALERGDGQSCPNCVVLSNQLWALQFKSSPDVIGHRLEVDGNQKIVIGVLPRNFRLVSSDIGVWALLDSASPPFTNFVERIGAVALMKPQATATRVESDLSDLTENAGYIFPASLLVVTSAKAEMRRTVGYYLLFLMVAIASAVAIVCVRRQGPGLGRAPLSLGQRFRWWAFFVAKSALLLISACLLAWGSIHAAAIYLVGSVLPMADSVALWLVLVLAIAPLSWSIHDQQKRCRVCLQLLGVPIRIGAPGNILFNWPGTEMVCPMGHGVLYLPDSEAKWLEGDRWNNLDDSWAGLFRSE
jgi:MacB-like periplasmic core domain